MDQDKLDFLANSIKNARNVMHKVESTNFGSSGAQGHRVISEEDTDNFIGDTTEYLNEDQVAAFNRQPAQHQQPQYLQETPQPMKNLGKSKMPEAILRSFAENPITDPSAPIGMDNLMQQIAQKAGVPAKAPQQPVRQAIKENRIDAQQPAQQAPQATSIGQIDTKLMEYIIRKTVEETLEQVNKKSSLSENIQIKIGDKTFSGKITSLNEIKTSKK